MKRILKWLAVIFLAIALLALYLFFQFRPAEKVSWGLSFSPGQARYLGADWRREYAAILDELQPKHLRLMALWEEIERERGRFDFANIDFLVDEAARRGAKIILVVGIKQPRWPECHEPDWARKQETGVRNQELLDYIAATVRHFKNNPAIAAWQVENEPFFPYGPDCATVSGELYRQEAALVKSLDGSRPAVATDSGEKGAWLPAASALGGGANIFGATMYRTVYYDKYRRYITYPIPPAFYRLKAGLVKTFSQVDRFIGVELQAEPWFAGLAHDTSWPRQRELMNAEIFAANVRYARAVGFAENYLWGVEWWYYAKTQQGDDSVWQAAKKLLAE